ncbi:GAF domain-containing protein [Frondihabitans australicus]|uniref:GAF domain-containing protein n=1 Tax=Frondihabitans australicus TaxID=386892 RepID=A0A495IHY3_9MICO|nr:GAF domain-containing protein [Frondihabitans australicus]RKR75642.1 GAF domain-containing protein [Frondihabitans australicus]
MTSPLRPLALPFFRGRFSGLGGRFSIPRPSDAPSAHSPGVDPDRILIFGNGAAVGWGVRSHDLALPGQLSRQLSAVTGRGVDADLVADPLITIQNAVDHLPDDRVPTYDAIVVVIGFSDALRMTSVRRWRQDMAALLGRLVALRSTGAEIVIQAIHRPSSIKYFALKEAGAVDAHAERLNAVTRELCDELPGVRLIVSRDRAEAERKIADEHGSHGGGQGIVGEQIPATELFRLIAATITAQLAPLLDDHFARGREDCPLRVRPQSDDDRDRAVRALGILDTPHEKRFDEIVERARVLLGTTGAAFSVVDRDRVWNKAVAGPVPREFPNERAMCSVTIRGDGPFVVPDVWEDSRFEATSELRFYAGYPVQTPDGIRIGALCVTDPQPRHADQVDLVLLRELALSVQRELSQVSQAF